MTQADFSIPAPGAIRPDLQLVAPSQNRLVCHQVQEAGTVYISMDALSLSQEGVNLHVFLQYPFWAKWSAKS